MNRNPLGRATDGAGRITVGRERRQSRLNRGGMMFRTMSDFNTTYHYLTTMTRSVFECLTDDNIGQSITDGHRTLGSVAWHIVVTVPEMLAGIGMGVSSVDHEAPPPATAEGIIDGYRRVVAEVSEAVEGKWGDEELLEEIEMYGEKLPRGKWLESFVAHEVHHRGQLTVLLRQAGVGNLPGVYGPSLEEWAKFGMDPPAY